MDRAGVAETLEELALLMELKGENPFKVRAFRNGARAVLALREDLGALVAAGRLGEIPGIGKGLTEAISALASGGTWPALEALRAEIPSGLLDVIRVPGLGPKRAHLLHDRLGVDSLAALEYACRENRLAALEGFGATTQAKILAGIEFLRRNQGRFLVSEADAIARDALAALEAHPDVRRAAIAGSLRRREEVIGALVLVAESAAPGRVLRDMAARGDVETVLEIGADRGAMRLRSGMALEILVVEDRAFAFALRHATGSPPHNASMERRARERFGLRLDASGLYRGGDGAPMPIDAGDEAAIFAALGLPFIPPELREDAGEIEAAEAGLLPRLVERGDLRGVLHVHSDWSDGRGSLEEMIRGAIDLGFAYVGISDHSRSAGYARGLKEPEVERQRAEIGALRERYPAIRILHGIESDILPDGALDYPDEVLARFDFVVGSIHSGFGMEEDAMTRRVIRAVENPRLTILGHPTGRLLLGREGFRIDLDAVILAAGRAGAFIETNANPHRLDLDAARCRRAREAGVLVSVNPDAHDVAGLADVDYGVGTARRGGLRAEDVLNTRAWEEIETLRAARRGRP